MALIQIVANESNINLSIFSPKNYAIEYTKYNFTHRGNGICIIHKICDAIIPEFLEFEPEQLLDIEGFNNLIKNIYFEFFIGEYHIFTIPLRFMTYLKEAEFCDNKFYVTIPFKMFFNEINLIGLQNSDVYFKLKNEEQNMFLYYYLTCASMFYIGEERITRAKDNDKLIQVLNMLEINQKSNCINFNFSFKGIHKGFFIECNNIDEINKIVFITDNCIKLNYNEYLIKNKCVKISQKLLYIPLNYNKSYLDMTNSGFEGSLNLSVISNLQMCINFNSEQSNIFFYGLRVNILRQIQGFAKFAYE